MIKKLNDKFIERLNLIYTKEELEIVNSWFLVPYRKTTFRVNTLKSTNFEIEKVLITKWMKFYNFIKFFLMTMNSR